MALVTVQRSPSVTGSPQCSNSDSEGDDEEGSKHEKSECFFAGKGTALVLALKDIPQYAERRLSTDSIRSTNSTQSNNSDIQQHLQSMFYLLRHEETLKMAVKLESQRANRTRYLVIASRCCYRSGTTERRSKIMRHNSARVSSTSSIMHGLGIGGGGGGGGAGGNSPGVTTRQLSMDGCRPVSQHQHQNILPMQQIDDQLVELRDKRLSASSNCSSNIMNVNRQSGSSPKCDVSSDKLNASGDSSKIATTPVTANANAPPATTTSPIQAHFTTSFSSASNATTPNVGDVGVEESCLLGIDCNESTTIGLVVPILADTTIHLDGDGGFSVSVYGKTHIFKPVSVQAMWSALQTLHKVSQKARENNFYPGGPSHDWLSYYDSRVESDQSCLNEWNAMDSIESRRPPSPDAIRNKPTAKEETEGIIKMKLKEIMMSVDLDEVTSKYIRSRLEEHLDMDLGEYKSFIDEEMLMILGQMDAPTEIFDHVYLGSEWNASNLEELQKNGVRHILNVTREIDNFFPGMFDYLNVRVYDDEKTNLLKHWDNTYRYISRAKAEGSKVLVHCKMGVSRSASVVIAYAMKAYNWEFQKALQHVKQRRNCIKPNKNFLNQLETYRGMLDAMKNKEKLQRSKSETNLKSTKDARLLPGSEPTPLIQALNQSKSKSGGDKCDAVELETVGAASAIIVLDDDIADVRLVGVGKARCCLSTTLSRQNARNLMNTSAAMMDHKHRRLARRSSSTSPRTVQAPLASSIVMKQQSQSLENLTPDRSTAEEPKNMRFPGSNGENYSVTQNQVLHIQKHTPPPPPPPPPLPSLSSSGTMNQNVSALLSAQPGPIAAAAVVSSVRTIVHDLENHQITDSSSGTKKQSTTMEDRKLLNLSLGKNAAEDNDVVTKCAGDNQTVINIKIGSPVWSASSKLVSQTTKSAHNAANEVTAASMQKRPHSRKTQSWAATSGGIVMDSAGSQSSIDSISTNASAPASTDSNAVDAIVRTRSQRQRELPSRHASWGSGDNRCGMPMRNSSWGAFDTNRNACQFNLTHHQHATSNAIFEGQIHELTTNNKTVCNESAARSTHHSQIGGGTVKRTKQKLEECTALKKLCQENGGHCSETEKQHEQQECLDASVLNAKRSSNLFRSASAAASTRSRFAQRCSSEELVHGSVAGVVSNHPGRRSDGTRPINTDLFTTSATEPSSYTMSDIENKNILSAVGAGGDADVANIGSDEENVVLRVMPTGALGGQLMNASEDQRISGNVQILKKSFEAKAGFATTATATSQNITATTSTAIMTTTATTAAATATSTSNKTVKQGHHSLPSSPVAQHHNVLDNNSSQQQQQQQMYCSASAASSSSSAAEQQLNPDSNVRGLVHKYQTSATTAGLSKTTTTNSPSGAAFPQTNVVSRQRPKSYYEQQRPSSGRMQYSDSRPPPAPQKTASAAAITATTTTTTTPATINHHTEGILTQQQQQQAPPQQRRLQQHGKTHPLSRLSLPKYSFNAATYNTM